MIEERYRLLAASFGDSNAGRTWRSRLSSQWNEAMGLLVHVLGVDLLIMPRELDGEHVRGLVCSLLPGRLRGEEPYRNDIVDLLEAFLIHIVEEESLTNAWELTRAVDDSREEFSRALKNPGRPVPASTIQRAPDRRAAPKIGRNEPCPCGSGRKYKHCCFKL